MTKTSVSSVAKIMFICVAIRRNRRISASLWLHLKAWTLSTPIAELEASFAARESLCSADYLFYRLEQVCHARNDFSLPVVLSSNVYIFKVLSSFIRNLTPIR